LNTRDDDSSATRPGWIPLLSLLAGLGLVVLGTGLVAAYVRASLAELSMLFWGLVLPGIGVPLLALGIGMLLLARHARRSPAAHRFATRALLVLLVAGSALACLGYLRWRQQQAAFDASVRQLQHDAARWRDARRLQPLALTLQPDALRVQAQPAAGLDGDYRWTLQVSDDRAILYTASRVLALHGAAAAIAERIAFSDLFRRCFDPAPPPSYACVAHAGSDNLLQVRGQLQLLADHDGPVTAPGHPGSSAAIAAKTLRIETFNTGRAIRVGRVRLDPP